MGFKGILKKFKWCLREVPKVFQQSFMGVSRKIKGCSEAPLLLKVQMVFIKSVKCFKEIQKNVSIMFQECYDEVLFCNFVVEWHSSHIPKQTYMDHKASGHYVNHKTFLLFFEVYYVIQEKFTP